MKIGIMPGMLMRTTSDGGVYAAFIRRITVEIGGLVLLICLFNFTPNAVGVAEETRSEAELLRDIEEGLWVLNSQTCGNYSRVHRVDELWKSYQILVDRYRSNHKENPPSGFIMIGGDGCASHRIFENNFSNVNREIQEAENAGGP